MMGLIFRALILALPLQAQGASPVSLDPPGGWTDVTESRNHPDVLVALHGPDHSSFVLTRLTDVDFTSSAGLQGLLQDIVGGIRRKTGKPFVVKGHVEKAVYKNDVTAYLLRCELNGRPRLVLGLAQHKGVTMLATLVSSVPDVWLPQTLGALRVRAEARPPGATRAVSLDGQLALDLPEGFESQDLTQKDQAKGMVLAVGGLGSELLFLKIPEGSADAKDEVANVELSLQAMAGVDRSTISPPRTMKSGAGPTLIYASASLKSSPDSGRVLAGYLPWGYWGYSLFAKGPRGAELMKRCVESLAPGPSAEAGLLAATPRFSLGSPFSRWSVPAVLAAVAAVVFSILALKGRKKQ